MMLTNDLVWTIRVLVVRVCTASHIGQGAAVARAMDAPASVVRKTAVSRAVVYLVAESFVSAGDDATVQPLSRYGVTGAIANKYIGVAHCSRWNWELAVMVVKLCVVATRCGLDASRRNRKGREDTALCKVRIEGMRDGWSRDYHNVLVVGTVPCRPHSSIPRE